MLNNDPRSDSSTELEIETMINVFTAMLLIIFVGIPTLVAG